jgi:hypothetical protein
MFLTLIPRYENMPTCKVIIQDEVNVKITNLDLDTRKALVKKFKMEDPTARFRPSYKLGRWDGAVSFFGLGGTTYVNMLEQVLPELSKMRYDFDLEDLRSSEPLEFDEISEDFWGDMVWPPGHRFAGEPIRLRDDQVEVVNNFLRNPQALQEVATGAGKTIMTATLSKICEKYGRTITIVPNKSLVEQTEEDFVNVKLDVGVYYGDRKDLDKTHTICTWQSLNILDKKSKDFDYQEESLTLAEFLEGIKCVIVDECFHPISKVLTPQGYIEIQNIKPGDEVINYSEDKKEFKIDTVIKLHKNLVNSTNEKMYELEFDNDVKIKVTGNHRFLTTIGWVRADQLTEFHEIINHT